MPTKTGKEPEGKKITIKGIAQRAKMGLEVDGVFLIGVSEEDKYAGKFVEVTGYVVEEQGLVAKPYKKGEPVSQGFESAPSVMRTIISIKIMEK